MSDQRSAFSSLLIADSYWLTANKLIAESCGRSVVEC